MFWRAISVVDEILRAGDTVVEDILFLQLRSCYVPFLAVFVATTKVHLCIDAAALNERKSRGGEARIQGNVETSVTVKQSWIATVFLQTFLVSQEHRNFSAVF